MVEAILFDFDLTLADSSAAVTECANHALRALGLAAAEPGLVHQTIGLSLVQSFRALRDRGLRTAIVSTKFRYRIEDILRRADSSGLVDVIVGGEDVAQHKPHPEGLLRALRLLDVHASRAVYVGDHSVDAQAAASAEIPFVGVLTGVTDAEAWAAFAPLRIIASVTELLGVLE